MVKGNKSSIEYIENYYSLEQIPFLVRALDFESNDRFSFPFLTYKMELPLLAKSFVGDFTLDL
ncbi:MAG: hypothetical protein WBG90_15750, partial [Saonia sp.]